MEFDRRAALTAPSYFANLISAPFHAGLIEAFGFAAIACLVAAAASWSRGRHYVHDGFAHQPAPEPARRG